MDTMQVAPFQVPRDCPAVVQICFVFFLFIRRWDIGSVYEDVFYPQPTKFFMGACTAKACLIGRMVGAAGKLLCRKAGGEV